MPDAACLRRSVSQECNGERPPLSASEASLRPKSFCVAWTARTCRFPLSSRKCRQATRTRARPAWSRCSPRLDCSSSPPLAASTPTSPLAALCEARLPLIMVFRLVQSPASQLPAFVRSFERGRAAEAGGRVGHLTASTLAAAGCKSGGGSFIALTESAQDDAVRTSGPDPFSTASLPRERAAR